MDMQVSWPIVTPMGLRLALAGEGDCDEIDRLVTRATGAGPQSKASPPTFSAARLMRWIDRRRIHGAGLWCVRLTGAAPSLIGCAAAWPIAAQSVRPVAVALLDEGYQRRYALDVVRGLSSVFLPALWTDELEPFPARPGLVASRITLAELACLSCEEGDLPEWAPPSVWSSQPAGASAPASRPPSSHPHLHPHLHPHSQEVPKRRGYEQ
jgi:hypothetical protein